MHFNANFKYLVCEHQGYAYYSQYKKAFLRTPMSGMTNDTAYTVWNRVTGIHLADMKVVCEGDFLVTGPSNQVGIKPR